jgi:hypothetical protein
MIVSVTSSSLKCKETQTIHGAGKHVKFICSFQVGWVGYVLGYIHTYCDMIDTTALLTGKISFRMIFYNTWRWEIWLESSYDCPFYKQKRRKGKAT